MSKQTQACDIVRYSWNDENLREHLRTSHTIDGLVETIIALRRMLNKKTIDPIPYYDTGYGKMPTISEKPRDIHSIPGSGWGKE